MYMKSFIFLILISVALGAEFSLCEECETKFVNYVKCAAENTVGGGECVGLDNEEMSVDWKGTGEMITAQDECERNLCPDELTEIENCYSTHCVNHSTSTDENTDLSSSVEKSVSRAEGYWIISNAPQRFPSNKCWLEGSPPPHVLRKLDEVMRKKQQLMARGVPAGLIHMIVKMLSKHLPGPGGIKEMTLQQYNNYSDVCADIGQRHVIDTNDCNDFFNQAGSYKASQDRNTMAFPPFCSYGGWYGTFNRSPRGSVGSRASGYRQVCWKCVSPSSIAVGANTVNTESKGNLISKIGMVFLMMGVGVAGYALGKRVQVKQAETYEQL